jgi:hypothetical protein
MRAIQPAFATLIEDGDGGGEVSTLCVCVGGLGEGLFVMETISAELLHSVCDYKLQNCVQQIQFFYKVCLFNLNRNTSSSSLAGYITGCVLENRGYLQILLTREKGGGAIC